MIWILFLLAVFLNGYLIERLPFPKKNIYFTLSCLFAFGSFFSVLLVYVLDAYIFKNLNTALYLFLAISFIFLITNRKYFHIHKISLSQAITPILLTLFTLLFSWYIFSKSFTYDTNKGQFSIASNVYADMGIHIPFIRSFSLGSNVPTEVPVFGNGNLPYHFMTDYYAGILEHFGLRIDFALNLISTFALTSLFFMIYSLSLLIFQSRLVGFLSVILFYCTSNFALFDFLTRQKSIQTLITSFWHNTTYYSAGPLGKNTIAVYWTLDTYLNQRQLIFGILFILIILHFILNKNESRSPKKVLIVISLMCAGLPLWNSPLFLALNMILAGFILLFPKKRTRTIPLFILSIIFSIPVLFVLTNGVSNAVSFDPGFLLNHSLNFLRFFIFWQWNLGFVLLALIFGFLFSDLGKKKLFIIFLLPFIAANLFQFGSDITNSHKLINLSIVLLNMFAAYGLTKLYGGGFYKKAISLFIIIFLAVGGLLNFLVVKNDVRTPVYDYPSNSLMKWSITNLPSSQTILTNGEIYDPLSLVGKKIFLGRIYYVQSYGGDIVKRGKEENILLEGKDEAKINSILSENNIHYAVFYKNNFAKNTKAVNIDFYSKKYRKIYEDVYGTVFKLP